MFKYFNLILSLKKLYKLDPNRNCFKFKKPQHIFQKKCVCVKKFYKKIKKSKVFL